MDRRAGQARRTRRQRKPALMEELGKVEKAFGTATMLNLRLYR